MTADFYLKNLWRRSAGFAELEPDDMSFESLKNSEWNEEFERLMRNRLLMGAFRYGKLNAPCKPKYDRVKSIIRRAEKYKETGNIEFLVDIANLCLCEFTEGDHPKKHFKSKDDGSHVNRV